MDVVEFLSARLNEDEAVARLLMAHPRLRWAQGDGRDGDTGEVFAHVGLNSSTRCSEHPDGSPNLCSDVRILAVDDDFVRSEAAAAAIAEHVARHDPARVLADVAAKRATLHEHGDVHCCSGRSYPDQVWPDIDSTPEIPCPTVRLLAAPFADHPDFDPAWKVEL